MSNNSPPSVPPGQATSADGAASAPIAGFISPELSTALAAQGDLGQVLLSLWRVLWKRHGWEEGARLAVGFNGGERVQVPVAFEGDPGLVGLAASHAEALPGMDESVGSTFDYDRAGGGAEPGSGLHLSVRPTGEGVALELGFDAEQFDTEEAARILARYEALVRSAVGAPGTPVGRLGLLPEAERRRVLVDFNDTHEAPQADVTIVQLIAQSVHRDPSAAAVLAGDSVLTYGELDERANLLAARLRALGVERDTFVAVHAEPSGGMLVGLLAVLKAGGAYLPLDPEYPDDRLAFMLEDSAAVVLLTQGHLPTLPTPASMSTIVLDDEGLATSIGPAGAVAEDAGAHGEDLTPKLGREPAPEDLAYLIYTSGSTGKPKGVRVDHRNLVHSTRARNSYYGGRVSRFLLLSSFAFDSSVAGLFWTLIDGGALVLPPAGAHRDPQRIGALMARHGVTHTLCLASHWRLILSGAEDAAFDRLETSIVSGEVFSDELVKRHDARAPGRRLFNEYGPTEGSVWSAVFDCHDDYPGHKVPMGRPIANTQLYLLDANMIPVPIGVPGELYQGGAGVAQGYLNRPHLTAERFVPDRFSGVEQARLYRTGDLARFLPDGNIEFLGRMDDQVKIRGYRIELGEIEAVIGSHDHVREASMQCIPDEEGDLRLVAYVVLEQGAQLSTSELRAFLVQSLPAYMLPGVTIFLDALPRTSIGKLAPEKLPPPPKGRPDTGAEYVPARNAVESALAGIWAEALELESVGVDDDFFALGGHSILAIRIMSRIKGTLGVTLPMRAFFDNPTVAELAAALNADPEHGAALKQRMDLIERVRDLSEDEASEHLAEHASSLSGQTLDTE